MLKVFRCWICGETYLGEEKPTDCPYCGADEEFLKPGEEYELPDVELTETSKNNLEEALELEVDNATFYYCAYNNAEGSKAEGMLKRLAKVESEHAEAICLFLNIEEPEIDKHIDKCAEDLVENLKDAHSRESRAIKHYRKFAEEAEEPRVEEFFEALAEIENDHLELHEGELK
ncbi:MAG: ferritin family protein [Candidatus Thermoplasmatota archaeon]